MAKNRNLRAEALAHARPGELVRIRENAKGIKRGAWFAWDCLFKFPEDKRGKCRLTLIAHSAERFD
jgi:hypothetical protein